MASEAGPASFEGEVLVVWGRFGLRPVALAAVHRLGAPTGPVVELALGGLSAGFRGRPVRRVLATTAPGAEPHGALKWFTQDRLREVHWEERGLRLWAKVSRRGVPARVPPWTLGEGPASARPRLCTRALLARVHIEVSDGGPVARFAGHRHGLLFSTARLAGEIPWVPLPRPTRAEPAPEAY